MANKSNDWGKLAKKVANKGLKAAAKALDKVDLNDAADTAQKGVGKVAKAIEGIDFNDAAKKAKKGVDTLAKTMEDMDLNEAAKKAQKGAKVVAKAIEGIDLNEAAKVAQKGVNAAARAVENIDLNEVTKAAQKGANAAANAVNNVVQDIKDIDVKALGNNLSEKARNLLKQKEEEEEANNKLITGKCAAKIMYYLMAADGEVYHDEEEKYNEICQELYPRFEADKDIIKKDCTAQLEKVIDTDDHYDVMIEGIIDAIAEMNVNVKAGIAPKMLLWDMFVVAYSDDSYSETEKKLIKYVSRKLNINKTVFLEMENSMLTLMALEEEEAWLKGSDRPYAQIESELKEVEDRKATVIESVNNLIFM